MAQRLIHLMPHRLAIYRWVGGLAHEEAVFDPELDLDGFAAFLAKHRKDRFLALTNLAEESFHTDTIPFLSPKDRTLVVNRRIGQLFQSAPLSLTVPLGYEKDRRKNERVLFASLNNSELLTPWLAAFRDQETLLEGIHSTAILCKAIAEKVVGNDDRSFVLTVHSETIRQSFFERKELHFSRLSRLTDSSINGLAQAFNAEGNRLYQYLLSQRILARAQPVTIHLIAHGDIRAAAEARCVSSDLLRYQFHDCNALSAQLGLKSTLENSDLDPLFLHLLATQPPTLQFAPAPLRHPFRLWQLSRALYAVAGFSLLAALLAAGKFSFDASTTAEQIAEEQRATQTYESRYHRLSQNFPKLHFSTDRLRAITADYAKIESIDRGLSPALSALARGLNSAPGIDIDVLDWSVLGLPGMVADEAKASATNKTGQQLKVSGIVRREPADSPRQVLARFDAFVETLRAQPGVTVFVDQQPFDVGSEKSISNAGRNTLTESTSRPFSLTLSLLVS